MGFVCLLGIWARPVTESRRLTPWRVQRVGAVCYAEIGRPKISLGCALNATVQLQAMNWGEIRELEIRKPLKAYGLIIWSPLRPLLTQ